MGVPAFYRWLVEKYPRCVVDVVEETPDTVNGACIPLDTSKPNPNGVEFDNLYLDMNGIIHPCFHPTDLPAPKTYDDVFKGVFKYIDRIFAMIRPRKLLYMAIDGVAPTAKMNQQRARRFRAAKEAEEELASKGDSLTGVDMTGGGGKVTNLDSNVITPGTEFMEMLSSALRYYIRLKMNSDPGWRGIKVILSDANVPGEGEHKIMAYIRLQRTLHGYDPNTRHCLYGLDADLIMLALATHEVHFSVLRENVHKEPQKSKGSRGSNYSSNLNMLHEGTNSSQGEEYIIHLEDYISNLRFRFLNIWVLREYLGFELCIPDPKVQVNLEQLIDDFVFMCIFVGNDFLPHVPSLEISEGAIDLLIMVYKTEFKRMGGYLTKSSKAYLSRVEHFVQAVGAYEDRIFKKRSEERKKFDRHLQRHSAARICKSMDHACSEAPISVDKVKLGEDGWKERYYCEKFEVHGGDACERIKRNTVLKYVEGIQWVMHYYYQGVCSWNWFYPYHYAPFASDFQGLKQLQVDFFLGKPLKPFDQLMAVLPASSAHALPLSYGKLMTDPSSPILDFYPSDFELDMNGKRHAWQAVCKLPFIEELRLLSEIEKVEHTLTDDEKRRNRFGLDQLFLHSSHDLATKILEFSKRHSMNPKVHLLQLKRKIEPELSDGMNGYIFISDNPVCPVEIFSPIDGMELIKNNEVISTFYELPKFHRHIPRLSKGVIVPEKSVSKRDVEFSTILWHEKTGFLRGRISQRRIPRHAISGSVLKILAHQLVSENVLVKQNGRNADRYMKNDSEVWRSEENCLMGQKVGHVDGSSEKISVVSKKEQTCLVESKDNNVDGSGESKSETRKRKGVSDIMEKKKTRKRRKKNNTNNHATGCNKDNSLIRNREGDGPDILEKKDHRDNAVLGTQNNSEYVTREQNCQADQNDTVMNGESEKNAEVRQTEQIIIVEENDSNVDCSGENKSKMRERGNIPEEIEQKRKKRKKENRNNPDKGTEVDSEDRRSEQNGRVNEKDFSVDRGSENSSAGRQQEGNLIVEQKDNNNADTGNEKNLELAEDQKDRYAFTGMEMDSGVRKRDQNFQPEQKDSNLNGSGLMVDKIEKRSRRRTRIRRRRMGTVQTDKGDAITVEHRKIEKNCQQEGNLIVGQKDNNNADSGNEKNLELVEDQKDQYALTGMEMDSEVRKRDQNFQPEQKDSNLNGSGLIVDKIEERGRRRTRIRRRRIGTVQTDKGDAITLEHRKTEKNCQQEGNLIVGQKDNNNADCGNEKKLELAEDQKDQYALTGMEMDSEVGKRDQNFQPEQKDGNMNGSGLMVDKIEKRSRRRRRTRNMETVQTDKGDAITLEPRKIEKNCHEDQEGFRVDGEGKSNSDVMGKEENFVVAQKHTNEG